MRHLKRFSPVILMIICLALAGCGSDSSGSTPNDPLAATGSNSGSSGNSGTGSDKGVIMFTSAAGATPGSQTNILGAESYEVDPNKGTPPPAVLFLPLIPFKLTDATGNARVGVPVTLYVYSITTRNSNDAIIDYYVPIYIDGVLVAQNEDMTKYKNQQTLTTDSAGQGVFNVSVLVPTPAPGQVNTVNVVFKAVADAIPPTSSENAVNAYVGATYSVTSKPLENL